MFNRYGVGELKEAYKKDGTKVVRVSQVMMMAPNNLVSFFDVVPDQDHFIYQNQLPITQEEIQRWNGVVPPNRMGPVAMCTCGSDAVLLLEGPYANHVICRSYLTTGKHQTSFRIVGNRLILDEKTISERTHDAQEIIEKDIRYKPKL